MFLGVNVLGYRSVNYWDSVPREIVSAPSVNHRCKGRLNKNFKNVKNVIT